MLQRILLTVCLAIPLFACGQRLPALIPCLEGDKWGYADTNGVIRIKPQWDCVEFFKSSRAIVAYVPANGDSVFCIIDDAGNYIIPPERKWNGIKFKNWDGMIFNAQNASGKYGIIDTNNKVVIPFLYNEKDRSGYESRWSAQFISDTGRNTYYAVAQKNGRFGIIDTGNRTIIPFQYDGFHKLISNYRPIGGEYYIVLKNEKLGVIDASNKQVIPIKYDDIALGLWGQKLVARLTINGHSVIAGIDGKILIDIPTYNVDFPIDSLIPVTDSSGFVGLMNERLEIMVPAVYRVLSFVGDSILVMKKLLHEPFEGDSIRYLDRRRFQPLSDWHVPMDSIIEQPSRQHVAPTNLGHHFLPEYYLLDKVSWFPVPDGVPRLKRRVKCRAITSLPGEKDQLISFAIIDSSLNYILPPRKTELRIDHINWNDSTLIVRNTDGQYAVADLGLKLLTSYQNHFIAQGFVWKGKRYLLIDTITTHCIKESNRHHSQHHCLKLADEHGNRIAQMANYTIKHSYGKYGDSIVMDYGFGGFINESTGYYLVEDEHGKEGIVSIGGDILFPSVSFKYTNLQPTDLGLFTVATSNDYLCPSKNQSSLKLTKGEPFLVNEHNEVLFDSIRVNYIEMAIAPTDSTTAIYKAEIYSAFVGKYNPRYVRSFFYVDAKKRGYFRMKKQ